jgi:hypothetical protein
LLAAAEQVMQIITVTAVKIVAELDNGVALVEYDIQAVMQLAQELRAQAALVVPLITE